MVYREQRQISSKETAMAKDKKGKDKPAKEGKKGK